MATTSERLRYILELDNRDAIQGFSEVGDAADKSAQETEGAFGGLDFAGMGGKLGGMLAKGFAAVGVGSLMVQSVNAAWERENALNAVTGRFDLTAQEAAKYGDIAGSLYAEGWGEGIADVIDAVAAVGERLDLTNADMVESVARSALAISQTWDKDVNELLRSTTQLMENDLVDSAEEAMSLIVGAFQGGADEAGDFLDTIDEYSQHFAAVGLDGQDMARLIVSGLQDGQRDADKMADAIKEMRLRVVENTEPVRTALGNIGLDADAVIDAFLEGGPAARDAFLAVVDALKTGQENGDDTANAVALIGTQFEDLGPKALDALSDIDNKLIDVTGNAQKLADTVAEESNWERFRRGWVEPLADVGDAILGIAADLQTNPFADGDWVQDHLDKVAQLEPGYGTASAGLIELQRQQDEARRRTGLYSTAIDENARRNEEWADATADTEEATDDLVEAIDDATDSFSDLKAEMSDRSAYLDAEDAVDDVRGAYRELIAAQEEYGTESEEAEAASRNMERALMDLKQDVIDYAAEVEGIPEQEITEILAMIDEGNLAGAEARLAALERDRVFRVKADTSGIPSWVRATNASGTTFYGAEGGIVTRPTMALIGEAGPEAVVPLNKAPGASPLPGGSGSGIGSSPGGNTYHIEVKTLAVDAEVERRLEQVVERIERKRKGMM